MLSMLFVNLSQGHCLAGELGNCRIQHAGLALQQLSFADLKVLHLRAKGLPALDAGCQLVAPRMQPAPHAPGM